MTDESKQMHRALIAPFPEYYINWKPQSTYQDQALAVCYIDARAVMDRMDAVFGAEGWKDEYQAAGGGGLNCRLWARWPDGEWTFHEGFGEHGGGDNIDPDKSAESDSLKRAAVKYGIGRYLYRIPSQWVECELKANGKFKKFKRQPTLPSWAIPNDGGATEPPKEPYRQEVEDEPGDTGGGQSPEPVRQASAASDVAAIGNETVQFAKKHAGKTVSQVYNEDPTFFTNFILVPDKFTPRSDSAREYVERVRAYVEAQEQPTASSGEHWTVSQDWQKFYAAASGLGLNTEDVHTALKVESAKDFRGTKEDAWNALVEFATETAIGWQNRPKLLEKWFEFLNSLPEGKRPSPNVAVKMLVEDGGNLAEFNDTLAVAKNIVLAKAG